MQKKRLKQFLILGLVGCLIFLGFGLDSRLIIRNYKYSDPRISNLRLLLITDLHGCYYGPNQQQLVQAIEQINPDLILLGGDIIDDKIPEQNSVILLRQIGSRYPCYYVSGNHEYWRGDIQTIKTTVANCGITILAGDVETLTVNGNTINVCGIDDPAFNPQRMLTQLKNVGQKINNPHFSVLLTHRPEHIDSYLNYDFDLILAGHAHGGQWRIPFLINGIYAPNQGLFPKYAGGAYQFDDTTFIVSRGLARESTKVPRFFNRPELVVIDY